MKGSDPVLSNEWIPAYLIPEAELHRRGDSDAIGAVLLQLADQIGSHSNLESVQSWFGANEIECMGDQMFTAAGGAGGSADSPWQRRST